MYWGESGNSHLIYRASGTSKPANMSAENFDIDILIGLTAEWWSNILQTNHVDFTSSTRDAIYTAY